MPHPSAAPSPLHRAVRLEKAREHGVQLEVGGMQKVQCKCMCPSRFPTEPYYRSRASPASTLDLTLHSCPRPNLTVNVSFLSHTKRAAASRLRAAVKYPHPYRPSTSRTHKL
ncbi:hypothetical protein B0H10DRAFT_1107730 [Mycena sp. CBHHK59/15]|nr:hypothetical protein B0H10DRAFT_1107730 [Mycena sp. CBHHK59/15]